MPYDDKEFLQPNDPGYAEAQAKRQARWAAREAELKNTAHVDKGEGIRSEEVSNDSPEFKSKIGKKIAATLTKAGDKAEDFRVKKNYLTGQVKRIVGNRKPRQQTQRTNTVRQPIIKPKPFNTTRNSSTSTFLNDLVSGQPPKTHNTSMLMNDLIGGAPKKNRTSSHINDLVGGTGGGNRLADDMIFGGSGKVDKKKKNGRNNDPFNGLLG